MFDICLLGTGGMVPLPYRYLTSLILRYNGTTILVDCGEGTQMPLQELRWGFKNINAVLFTHYHGDHITGLPGILYQMLNAERTEKLILMGPKGISIIENMINVLFKNISFDIEFRELAEGEVLNIGDIVVKNAPVYHTIPCYGYSFEVKRLPVFDVEKARKLHIPVKLWNALQHGQVVQYDGCTYTPEMVWGKERKGLKVSYSTDTRPTESLIDLIKESDLFIGEGMYGDDRDLEKAIEKCHSTFSETARIAKEAKVTELWLTHYSPSLVNPEKFIKNATSIFHNTVVGKDLMTRSLKFSSQ